MSSHHVPDPLLRSFVDGDVDEQVATDLAMHLDACPTCSARAAALEPLAAAFAAVPDPSPPDDLVAAVLAEAATTRERVPTLELTLSAAFLAAAALAVLLGDPVAILVDLGLALQALGWLSRSVAAALGDTGRLAVLATLLLGVIGASALVRVSLRDPNMEWRLS